MCDLSGAPPPTSGRRLGPEIFLGRPLDKEAEAGSKSGMTILSASARRPVSRSAESLYPCLFRVACHSVKKFVGKIFRPAQNSFSAPLTILPGKLEYPTTLRIDLHDRDEPDRNFRRPSAHRLARPQAVRQRQGP